MFCCIGDLVEDVVVRLSSDIATGSDTTASIVRRRGGSAANVSVAAASCGLNVRFIGKVGADSIGASLVEELRSAGVDPRIQRGGRTGTIVVLVDSDGERSMLPDRGAATELTEIAATDLEHVEWLHVPAYSLVVEPIAASTKQAIALVRRAGATVSVDASSVAIINEMGVNDFKGVLKELQPDVVLCNTDEGATLGVSESKGLAGVGVTIVKAGSAAAVAYADGNLVASVPALKLGRVRDTTGAGDAFAAGFISGRMRSWSVEHAISEGHRVAAQVLTEHSS